MKEVYTAELEKVIAEHVSCQAEALVTAEHLAMLKADGVVGSVWERALVENARAAAAERIAFIILESVRLENKVCDAFYTWVQWRYQLLRSVKEVQHEIGVSVPYMPSKPDELIAFWRNFSRW